MFLNLLPSAGSLSCAVMKALVWGSFLFLYFGGATTSTVEGFILPSHKKQISTTINPPRRLLPFVSRALALADGTDDDHRSWEADHVAIIRQCTSLEDMKAALESSMKFCDTSLNNKSRFPQHLSPNVAATALYRMATLTSRQVLAGENKSLIWSLVNRLEEVLVFSDRISSLTAFALVDSISALAVLKRKLKFEEFEQTNQASEEETGNEALNRLAITLVDLIDKDRSNILRVVRPSRLVDVLHALHVLGVGETDLTAPASTATGKINGTQQSPLAARLQMEICQKLAGGHALSVLSAGDMSIALKTLAAVPQPLDSVESKLAIALMRRFRKQAVRRSANARQLLQSIEAVTSIGVAAKQLLVANGDGPTRLCEESQLMVYTVSKECLQKESVDRPKLKNNLKTKNKMDAQDSIGLQQITTILRCLLAMEVLEKKNEDSATTRATALSSLWESCLHSTGHQSMENASVDDMAQFLRSVEACQFKNLTVSPDAMRNLGENCQKRVSDALEVDEHFQATESSINPQSANTILRYAALSFGTNHTVLKPFLTCAQNLFTDEIFLSSCGVSDLTNFLTFLEKTKFHTFISKKDPLLAIAERILDYNVSETMSPTQASRILASFTAVVAERSRGSTPSEAHTFMTRQLFHTAGGHLLTTNPNDLSPRDISSALCAYAKASYAEDMGIFDHLASLLAARVEDCSIRQVAQSLWACGKMTMWESKQQNQGSYQDQQMLNEEAPPPYIPSANQYTDFLLRHRDDMSSKDIAQAVWAMARLQSVRLSDDDESHVILDRFLSRATTLAPQLTSQEVANILWGLSRTGYRDCGPLVESFTDRILNLHEFSEGKCTPQEAANVMMALGRMNIQDERVFQVLSDDMLDQLGAASAQAIANALWAHQTVHITPPYQLLDQWASERLGLDAVVQHRKP